jgi:hypothetical protein
MCSRVLGCAEDFSEKVTQMPFQSTAFQENPQCQASVEKPTFQPTVTLQYSDHLLDFKFWTRTLEDSEKSFKAWSYDTCRGKFWVHYSIPSAKYILQMAFNFGIAKKLFPAHSACGKKPKMWMRSSLVVRASDCQCTSCNGPGFDPSIRRHSGI